MTFRIGSLCSGIGGLEMGLERALGAEVIWQVEIEPHCRAVLAATWPNAERFNDVLEVGSHNLAPVDLICFGSPCQDLSSAGNRAGLNGPKSRLFYECARVVGELRPEWVVFENVASGASRWVDAVRKELEQFGYATLPEPLSASDCGAPHPRARVFIIAHADRAELRIEPGGAAGRTGATRYSLESLAKLRQVANPHHEQVDVPTEARREDDNSSGPRVCPSCCGAIIATGQCVAGDTCQGCAFDATYADREFGDTRQSGSRGESAGRPVAPGITAAAAMRAGREGPGPDAHEERGGPAADGWRPPIPDILRVVHGVSGGPHVADSALARRARRLEASAARKRVAALGNACTPQQAEVIGHIIRVLIEAGKVKSA